MTKMSEREKEFEDQPRRGLTGRISPLPRQVILALLGATAFFTQWAVTPEPISRSVLQPNPPMKGPMLVVWLLRLAEFIHGPYVAIPGFLMFLLMAVCQRDRKMSWIYAFIAGYSFPWILFRWVLHWI
jgi:hypothetical protein